MQDDADEDDIGVLVRRSKKHAVPEHSAKQYDKIYQRFLSFLSEHDRDITVLVKQAI